MSMSSDRPLILIDCVRLLALAKRVLGQSLQSTKSVQEMTKTFWQKNAVNVIFVTADGTNANGLQCTSILSSPLGLKQG